MATSTHQEALAAHNHLPHIGRESAIFKDHPKAAYFVGLVALCGTELLPDVYLAARQLRFNKYKDLGWLMDDKRDADGGEHDEDDARSAEFAVVSNDPDGPVVIATSRLILKDIEPVRPLPVETHYPEAFVQRQVLMSDTEAGRMISDSKNSRERALATAASHRAMIGWGMAHGYYNAYAMVEEWLMDRFDMTGVPYTQLSELKGITEYGDTKNAAIAINPKELVKRTQIHQLGVPLGTKLFFHGIDKSQGLGYYGSRLLRRQSDG